MKKVDDFLKKGWILLPMLVCFIAGIADQYINMPILYDVMKWSGILFFALGVYVVGKTLYLSIFK